MQVAHFRLRTWLIVIAILGVVLGVGSEVGRLLRVSEAHRVRAAYLTKQEWDLRRELRRSPMLRNVVHAMHEAAVAAEDREKADSLGRKLDEHLRWEQQLRRDLKRTTELRQQHERAASRPWTDRLPLYP